MERSESIAKLAEALAKAQGVMEGSVKDAANPFFKSAYSTLAAVWDSCRKPLADNGLSVVQVCSNDEVGNVVVETMMMHLSGEWISGRFAMKPVKIDPQSIGSVTTYCRRYSLQSMVGIAPEDDDGNAASGKDQFCKPTPPVARFEGTKIPVPTKNKEDVKDFPNPATQSTAPPPANSTTGIVVSHTGELASIADVNKHIAVLKEKLSTKMGKMQDKDKVEFFKFVIPPGKTEDMVENLTLFLENYDTHLNRYINRNT